MKLKVYSIIVVFMFGANTFAQSTNKDLIPDINTKVDGEYVGGLKVDYPMYSNQVRSYKYLVQNKTELLEALEKAKRGDVIFVSNDAEIDLTGHQKITIRAGVTLASGRGDNNHLGGMIKTNDADAYPLFVCGSNVTIKGLRFG